MGADLKMASVDWYAGFLELNNCMVGNEHFYKQTMRSVISGSIPQTGKNAVVISLKSMATRLFKYTPC
uniref:Uncharacterized protein n=1 Tax=Candidozyma auris TaxID=498019 RepID=A0A0L0NV45_CANAR